MPTLETIIATKVTGLGEISGLRAEMAGLGAQTDAVAGSSGKLTGATTTLSGAQGEQKIAAAAVSAETAALGSKAEVAAVSQGKLSGVTSTLANTQLAQKGAVAETTAATAGLAVVQGEAAVKTAAQNDAMATSTAIVGELALVDGTLIGQKKEIAKAVQEEGQAHGITTEQIKKSAAATGEFGEAGVRASEKLSGLGSILGGAGGVSAGLAGLVIGLGATVAIAKSGIDTFETLGTSVLKYQRVTGASADESSRMIDVFGQLGVDGDKASAAMFMLNKRIEGLDGAATKTSKSLAQIGVEVAKNADGSTNLEQTLFNVADAYNASGSAAERDSIATVAFGKAGSSLIPVLEQGRAGLQAMADQATLLFTQQQLEQAHQYEVEQSRLGQESHKLGQAIGGVLVPVLSKQVESWNKSAEAAAYADAKMGDHNRTTIAGVQEYNRYYDAGLKVAESARAHAEATSKETDQLKALDEQLRRNEASSKALYDSDLKGINAGMAKEQADLHVLEAQKTLADETVKDAQFTDKHTASVNRIAAAQANLTKVVQLHGATSAQAKAAQDQLNAAQDAGKTLAQQYADQAVNMTRIELALKEAMVRDAEATVAAAAETASLGGETLSTREKTDLMREALQREADTLAPGSALRAQLQGYIDALNNIPADKTTNLHLNVIGGTPSAPTYGVPGGTVVTSAEGGVFTRPTLTWVGEAGPEAVIPLRQGNTMPGASPLESQLPSRSSVGKEAAGPSRSEELLGQAVHLLAQIAGAPPLSALAAAQRSG